MSVAHRWTDEAFVREDLEALGYARGEFAAALDFAEMIIGDGAFCERGGEFVRGGDRILNRKIDAHSTNR